MPYELSASSVIINSSQPNQSGIQIEKAIATDFVNKQEHIRSIEGSAEQRSHLVQAWNPVAHEG